MSSSAFEELVNDKLVFIKRKRGQVLLYLGHQYYKNKIFKNKSVMWLCRMFNKSKCNGSLTIDDKNEMIKSKNHTCPSDIGQNMIDYQMYKLNVASTSFKPVPTLYKKYVRPLKDQGIDIIKKNPNLKAVKSGGVYKHRNKDAKIQKLIFKNPTDVEIPPKYSMFVLSDYTYNTNRIVTFASAEAKACIGSIKHLFGDGTFKSCASPFGQLYTIHGDLGSSADTTNIVPLIYALMTDRKEESYYAMFSMIKSQIPDMNPSKFSIDFEKSAINAIQKVFPGIELSGCYYHFSNSVWKKGKKLGITEDMNTKRIVALSAILPLLPTNLISEGWTYIANDIIEGNESLLKFQKYMMSQWLKNQEWMKIWSVYGERHRTNNFAESWHNNLNNMIGRKQPNIMKLLKTINSDADYYGIRIKVGVAEPRDQKLMERDNFIMITQMMLNDGQRVYPTLHTLPGLGCPSYEDDSFMTFGYKKMLETQWHY